MIIIAVLYFLFAITFILAKSVLYYISPLLLIGIRMTLAGTVLLGYLAIRKNISIVRKSWPLLVQLIFFHIYLAYGAEFWALQFTSSTKTALIYNMSPFITALLVAFLGYERVSRTQWVGLGIGFCALVPWALSTTGCEDIFGSLLSLSIPELVLLIAVTSSAYGWILVGRLIREYRYAPALVNGIAMFFGGLLALISSYLIEGATGFIGLRTLCSTIHYQPLLSSDLVIAGGYLAGLIIIANLICYNLYGYLLHRYSATLLSFAGSLCPLFTGILEWLIRGEPLTGYFYATLLLTTVGLYVFYRSELRHQ